MSQFCLIICDQNYEIRKIVNDLVEIIFQDHEGIGIATLFSLKCAEVKDFLKKRGDVADVIIAPADLYYMLKSDIGISEKIGFIYYSPEHGTIEKINSKQVKFPNIAIFDSQLFSDRLKLLLQLQSAFRKIGYLP